MPVIIGVFINPGSKGPGLPFYGSDDIRSVEYNTFGDQYVRFWLAELLLEVQRNYSITADPDGRAICGSSADLPGVRLPARLW